MTLECGVMDVLGLIAERGCHCDAEEGDAHTCLEGVAEAVITSLRAELDAAMADKIRLDWLDWINPIGCWDGWVDEGELSRSVTVAPSGEGGSIRECIDAAREEKEI